MDIAQIFYRSILLFFSSFWPCDFSGLWNLSSLTRDWTSILAMEAWNPNDWTGGELLIPALKDRSLALKDLDDLNCSELLNEKRKACKHYAIVTNTSCQDQFSGGPVLSYRLKKYLHQCLALLHFLIITPWDTSIFPLVLMSLAINFIAKNACFFSLSVEYLHNLLMLVLRLHFPTYCAYLYFSSLALNSS